VTGVQNRLELASRASEREPHPDHHLWRNGRTWWIAFTFHTNEGKKYRVRRSLGTERVSEARARRDELLASHARQPGWRLALRFVPRAPRAERGAPLLVSTPVLV
jgi:hypothetical protein